MEVFFGHSIEKMPECKHDAKDCSVIIGKFDPPHLGHIKLINNSIFPPCVFLTRSKNHFLSVEKKLQIFCNLLRSDLRKDATFFVVDNTYIPGIIKLVRVYGFEPREIRCGSDRSEHYLNQINEFNRNCKYESQQVSVNVSVENRIAASSDLRKMIQNQESEAFRNSISEDLWDFYSEFFQ